MGQRMEKRMKTPEHYYVLGYYMGDTEIEHEIRAISDADAQAQAFAIIRGGEYLYTCISLVSCDTHWSFDYGVGDWVYESSAYDYDGMEHAEYDPYGDEQHETTPVDGVPF
jgi:hypothetical protein